MTRAATRSLASAAGIAAVLALGAASRDARAGPPADEAAANAAFDRGVELYRGKRYREAAEQFDHARDLAPRGPTAYNAARAWKAAGDGARAGDDYALALALGDLTDPQRKEAGEQLRVIEQTFGVVDLDGPAGATARVGGGDERALPAHVHVPPGSVVIVFAAQDGATETERALVVRGEHASVSMHAAARVAPREPSAPPPAPPPAAPPASPSEARTPALSRRGVGVIAFGGAAVMGALGAYLGIDGKAARDAFVSAGSQNPSLHDQAVSERLWADVLFVGAAAAVGVGVYLFVTPSRDATSAASAAAPAMLRLGLAPGGASIAGAFR